MKIIISKIENMKDFGKLLKLFNLNDEKSGDYATVVLVSERYRALLKTYKSENCPNFVKETALLIYLFEKNKF